MGGDLKTVSRKRKSKWVCTSCGYESSGYLGRCLSCGTWGSLKECSLESSQEKDRPKNALFISPESDVLKLDEIPETELARYKSGFAELDRVLGGGIVPGSLTLIGGSPGIGKSTILLQSASNFSKQKLKVFYVSAEESSQQLKLRASRLKVANQTLDTANILVYAENNLEKIIEKIKDEAPNLVIVDSIQAIYLPGVDSIPGSVTQIRETASNLMRFAKASDIPIMVVGHINKDGDIAGPKILEHMVDTVLQFEGEKDNNFRILRSIKNRFGSTDEVGLFDMTDKGLSDLNNPSEIFLKQRSGGVVFATREGNRSLLLELQSLIINSDYNHPRRITNGTDLARLHQILAVLEKKTGVSAAKSDVYLNVVGGLKIKEPAADLAIALSVYLSTMDSYKKESNNNEELTKDLLVLGEIGLSGEIRAINNLDARLKEAQKLGFKRAIVPRSNLIGKSKINYGMELIAVKNITDAINTLRN